MLSNIVSCGHHITFFLYMRIRVNCSVLLSCTFGLEKLIVNSSMALGSGFSGSSIHSGSRVSSQTNSSSNISYSCLCLDFPFAFGIHHDVIVAIFLFFLLFRSGRWWRRHKTSLMRGYWHGNAADRIIISLRQSSAHTPLGNNGGRQCCLKQHRLVTLVGAISIISTAAVPIIAVVVVALLEQARHQCGISDAGAGPSEGSAVEGLLHQ